MNISLKKNFKLYFSCFFRNFLFPLSIYFFKIAKLTNQNYPTTFTQVQQQPFCVNHQLAFWQAN